jgi:hypothetical protein
MDRSDFMATTAQEIFEIAMALMDEQDSAADSNDTAEYKQRTLYILTALRGELYPFSDTFAASADGRRPICPAVTAFDTPLGLDDFLCQTILPYGLAARLLLEENPVIASFFEQRYEELLSRYGGAGLAVSEAILDLYGGVAVREGGV